MEHASLGFLGESAKPTLDANVHISLADEAENVETQDASKRRGGRLSYRGLSGHSTCEFDCLPSKIFFKRNEVFEGSKPMSATKLGGSQRARQEESSGGVAL